MATPQIPLVDLIAELSDPNSSIRRAAIKKIMRRRKERGQAFQHIARLLNDGDAPVRSAALKALGQLGDARALPYLVHLLNGPNSQVRFQTVRALETLGGTQVMPYLIMALSDQTARVRVIALNALVKLGSTQVLSQLLLALTDQEVVVRLNALEHLYLLQGAQASQYLLAAMTDCSEQIRGVATRHLTLLGQTNTQVVQELLKLTSHSDGKSRVAVFAVLAHIDDPSSFSAMLQGLDDEEIPIRISAVSTLGKLGDTRAVKPLLALCNDSSAQVRLRVAEVLGKLGDPQALEPLLTMLRDPDNSVCAYAAWSLDALNDPRALPALAARFSSSDDLRLRGTTMKALSSLVAQAPAEITRPEILEQFLYAFGDSYVYIREDALKALRLSACKPLLLQPLLSALTRPDAPLQIRVAALKVLEIVGCEADPQALDTFLELIERESEYIPVRTKAIGLLAKSQDSRAVESLLRLLTSPDISLREAASEALGLLDDPRALEPLRALLAQTTPGHLSVLLQKAIAQIASGACV